MNLYLENDNPAYAHYWLDAGYFAHPDFNNFRNRIQPASVLTKQGVFNIYCVC